MSVRLMSLIWSIPMVPTKKLPALKLADCGSDDGKNMYPSVPRIAYETGLSERTVQRAIKSFVDDGILKVQAASTRRHPTVYMFDVPKLEGLARPYVWGVSQSPQKDVRGDSGDNCGVTASPTRGDHLSPYPSIEPSLDPSGERGADAPTPPKVLKKGSRIDPNWKPTPENVAFAKKRGMTDGKITTAAALFLNHFKAAAGAKGVRLDWDATWNNWIIRDTPDYVEPAPREKGTENWSDKDLQWLWRLRHQNTWSGFWGPKPGTDGVPHYPLHVWQFYRAEIKAQEKAA